MSHNHTLKFNNKPMNCTNCEDSGYTFDTLWPCRECDLGNPIQHQHDLNELKRITTRAKVLRKQIKSYKESNA